MHYLYSNGLMNQNQFGFTPKKSNTDAAMAVKDFIEEALTKGQIIALVRLDVKGAFDATWWQSILKAFKAFQCSKTYIFSLRITLGTEQPSFHQIKCE
jgi:hypothetical protein